MNPCQDAATFFAKLRAEAPTLQQMLEQPVSRSPPTPGRKYQKRGLPRSPLPTPPVTEDRQQFVNRVMAMDYPLEVRRRIIEDSKP